MMIRVVVIEPGKAPEVREIEDSLEAMQAIVRGYLEKVPVRFGGLDVFVNEKGRLDGMPFNQFVEGFDLLGPILVSAADAEGEQRSLTDDEVAFAMARLREGRPS